MRRNQCTTWLSLSRLPNFSPLLDCLFWFRGGIIFLIFGQESLIHLQRYHFFLMATFTISMTIKYLSNLRSYWTRRMLSVILVRVWRSGLSFSTSLVPSLNYLCQANTRAPGSVSSWSCLLSIACGFRLRLFTFLSAKHNNNALHNTGRHRDYWVILVRVLFL